MTNTLSPASAEKVNQIVVRSNFKDLTPETLLEAFKAEGIASLEDLAKRITNALQNPKGRPQRIPYDTLFSQPTPPEVLARIEHQVPEVPFVLDGELHDPGDIVKFNGQELGFISQAGGKELLVLSDKSVWAPFLKTTLLSRLVSSALEGYQYGGYSFISPQTAGPGDFSLAPPPIILGQPVHQPSPPWISLWTDSNISGKALVLEPGESRRNLLEVSVGGWPFSEDFNDKCSSFTRTTSLCIAFEHIHFQGSFLWLGPSSMNTSDLSWIGWNDRISSVINGG
jgi:hypothetical protein